MCVSRVSCYIDVFVTVLLHMDKLYLLWFAFSAKLLLNQVVLAGGHHTKIGRGGGGQ